MGNIGYCTRGTRMLQIVKGSDLVSGIKQTAAYKVGNDTIFSGEVIYAVKNTNGELEWTKTKTTSSAPFFAFTDSDSFDVIAAGSLLGISVLDTFELQTPLFDEEQVYTPGAALYVGTANLWKNTKTGDVVCSTVKPTKTLVGDVANVADEWAKVNTEGPVNCVTSDGTEGTDDVIGYVTEGVVQLKGNVNVAAVNDAAGAMKSVYLDGYQDSTKLSSVVTGGPSLYTEASGSKYVLQFATAYKKA